MGGQYRTAQECTVMRVGAFSRESLRIWTVSNQCGTVEPFSSGGSSSFAMIAIAGDCAL